MNESETIFVSEDQAGKRLDLFLTGYFRQKQSRSYFQYLIANHLVLINGRPVKKRICPKAGDEIEVEFALLPEISLSPENIPLDIIFEDDHLLAINKPAGMVVHPAPGHWSGTFVNALLFHCGSSPDTSDTIRPGIIHRLDKDTTGVLVAAKNTTTHQRMVSLFAQRDVTKEYIALCHGNPGNGTLSATIGRHPTKRKQMAIVETGKSSTTTYSTIFHDDKCSIVIARPQTGRTHQIRVHMKHIGSPILGDTLYGKKHTQPRYHAYRHCLHAHRLTFAHPITGKILLLYAPIPDDMLSIMNTIDPQQQWKKEITI